MALQQRRARSTPAGWVVLAHDGIEGTHRCPESAVAHWEDRGWRRVQPDAETVPPLTAEPPAEPSRTSKPARGAAPGTES